LPKKYAYLWNKIISAPRTELLKSKENKSVEKQDNISGRLLKLKHPIERSPFKKRYYVMLFYIWYVWPPPALCKRSGSI
jgi:hypothetical protein